MPKIKLSILLLGLVSVIAATRPGQDWSINRPPTEGLQIPDPGWHDAHPWDQAFRSDSFDAHPSAWNPLSYGLASQDDGVTHASAALSQGRFSWDTARTASRALRPAQTLEHSAGYISGVLAPMSQNRLTNSPYGFHVGQTLEDKVGRSGNANGWLDGGAFHLQSNTLSQQMAPPHRASSSNEFTNTRREINQVEPAWFSAPRRTRSASQRARRIQDVSPDNLAAKIQIPEGQAISGLDEVELSAWANRIGKALKLENLRVSLASPANRRMSSVFVGTTGYPQAINFRNAPRDSDGAEHFLTQLSKLAQVKDEIALKFQPADQVYLYLDDAIRRASLNREYFQGHLRFLPINTENLLGNIMSEIRWGWRGTFHVLPPSPNSGLPLVALRHGGGPQHELSKPIQLITGETSLPHVISLWSPVLQDGKKYLSVLYGIAQLDSKHINGVTRSLSTLVKQWDPANYGGYYSLPHFAEAPR